MKVKELIEELKKFDENMEVQYDFEYQTVYIEKVSLEREDYSCNKKEVVVIF